MPNKSHDETILTTIQQLNEGKIRVAEPTTTGWRHNPDIQSIILEYFKSQTIETKNNPWPHRDLIPAKYPDSASLEQAHHRIVPPCYIRYGAYIGKQVIAMPCFVNIGAYVDDYTMLDTWSTIGSCAQIGKHVHISGGAGIGGVLEPANAKPVIIEDHCFIGARCEIAEGVIIKQGAVLAPGTFLTQSTRIYDRTNNTTTHGVVPENAVVVPGTRPDSTGQCQLQAAIIVKYANNKTRGKTALNDFLRSAEQTCIQP
jgi:2,3,4,5-tetrahydropyridine-2-carboxylate N-succinyltransferase